VKLHSPKGSLQLWGGEHICRDEEMVRVVHIISGDLWAGAESMACNLVRELLGHPGLDLSVYLLNGGTLAERLGELPVDLTVSDEQRSSFLQLLSTTRHWLNHRQPHIIHSHRYKENILAYLASRGRRTVHLLATQHGLPETGSRRLPGLVAGLNRSLLRYRFDKVVGVSNNIRDHFRRDCGIQVGRLAVVNNGIDLPSNFTSYAQKDQFVVGSAGRLFPVKDYSLMIEVARCVAQTAPATKFMLAGEGPQRSNLEGELRGQSLENLFSLLGHLEDIPAFYGRLDVYINTSVHEGVPMSILEAMAHGLPVVAPDVGGIGEIIENGVDGFLVAGRNPEDFADPILKLQDAKLRRRIGEAAREKIRRSFSAQSMAEQYYQLYRELAT
jgi:glycosyltransferase involved in cell wall biosynthesis